MVKYWVPVIQPPHPGEISCISPFAEGIIQNLRYEAYKNEEKLKLLRPQQPNNNDWFQNTYNQSQTVQLNFNGVQIPTQNTWFPSQLHQINRSPFVSQILNQQPTSSLVQRPAQSSFYKSNNEIHDNYYRSKLPCGKNAEANKENNIGNIATGAKVLQEGRINKNRNIVSDNSVPSWLNDNQCYDTNTGIRNYPPVPLNSLQVPAINLDHYKFRKCNDKQSRHSNFNANGKTVFETIESSAAYKVYENPHGSYMEKEVLDDGYLDAGDYGHPRGNINYAAEENQLSCNLNDERFAGVNKHINAPRMGCRSNADIGSVIIPTADGGVRGELVPNDYEGIKVAMPNQEIGAFDETALRSSEYTGKENNSVTYKAINNNRFSFNMYRSKPKNQNQNQKTQLSFVPNKKPIQSKINYCYPVKKNYSKCATNKAKNCVDETSKNAVSHDEDNMELPSNKVSGYDKTELIRNSKEISSLNDKADGPTRIEQFTTKMKSKLEMFKAVEKPEEKIMNADVMIDVVENNKEGDGVLKRQEVSVEVPNNAEEFLFPDDAANFFDSELDSQLMKVVGTVTSTLEVRPNNIIDEIPEEPNVQPKSTEKNNEKAKLKGFDEKENISENKVTVFEKKESVPEKTNTRNLMVFEEENMPEKTENRKLTALGEKERMPEKAEKRKLTTCEEKENTPIPNSQNKRIKFQAPLKKKLVQTKLFDSAKLSDIINLNKCSLLDLESQMNYCTPMEICFTIQFSNGSTQLSNPENSGTYKAILLRIMWQEDNVEICSIGSDLWKTEKSCVKDFFRTILNTKSSLICVESAELMLFLIQKFNYERNLTLKWQIFDPLIAYWLLEPDDPCNTFASLVDALDLNNAKKAKGSRSNNCKHLDLLSEGFNQLKTRLKEEGLWNIFSGMEVKLTPILARMTQRGLQLNEVHLREIGSTITKRLVTLECEAQKLVGCPFLLTSAVQLRRVLFDNLKLDQQINMQVKGTTALGAKSTSEAVLKQLAHVHPLPNIILEHRRLHKLKTTFIDGILTFVKKGTVHTIWEQRSAATGRLASSNPNLQSIPKQWFTIFDSTNSNLDFNIRSAFLPRKGYTLLLADFQQIEFRIFAHLTQDPALVDILLKSVDVFLTLAERWLGCDDRPVSSEDREKTKRIVYAVMYGAGPSKLAEFLNISHQDALSIYNKFCASFPIMKKFPKQVAEKCAADGKLTTVMGRVRKFKHITDTNSALKAQTERQALNFLIQGAAADICKQAMLQCENEIINANPPLDAHLLLQIHDELIWEVSENHLSHFKEIVKVTMENCRALDGTLLNLSVPIKVKIIEQSNWAPEEKAVSS